MTSSTSAETGKVVRDVLVEFVEVAIHSILYNRELYPQGAFEKRVKYNVPVQMCLHPDVCEYIGHLSESLLALLSEGRVNKISVVILHPDTQAPIERYVLEIGDLKNQWSESDPYLLHTEQALRGFLLKLNISDALLQPAPKEATWTVHVHTKASTLAAVEEQFILNDFPWAVAQEKEQNIQNAKLVPLRSMNTDMLNMQLYVEEENRHLSG
ncbi:mitotic spindle assembly checkpoint protein MAD2B-like [Physella acuta]|uniref:mitotic spindle assembly checkpoint protein MAD2B-like n=1 Tax=Physella acuta TaxID=109671 RepID=UPI0027DC1099|nr:mitotic spindle assembly checkpoint protein MAD2B-like [Physella acuta]XP_059147344.1 mitotic spindle assembly checkpoint protein MAD2B-like [Physella acuta]XP_059147345.1 mitotic spindle assembly checkpoint protein MAD2B-like [Physella acuta]XP_059147346.1 mitotic spindle assembly checkpoint protein MAD2B-like [Physella acuta]